MRMTPRVGITAKNPKESLKRCEIVLPFSSISEDHLWCPVRKLKWYISRKYPQSKQLFISLVTPQIVQCSLASWIVQCIRAGALKALFSVSTVKVGMATSWVP